jgi:tetratricopeptide (TPR) repeat protein
VQTAAVTLLVAPLVIIPLSFGAGALGLFIPNMGPWLLFCVAAFVAGRRLSPRTLWAGLLGLLAALVLLAQGRGAWLAALASLAAMGLGAWRLAGREFFRRRWALLRWPLALALAGAGALGGLLALRQASPQAAWIGQGAAGKVLGTVDSLASRSVHIFDKADDAQVVRRFYWQAAWELGLGHPILGIGYGDHALLTARAQSAVWKRWDAAADPRAKLVEPHVELYTHDDYLQNFAETGAAGLAAFLQFWGWLAWGAWRLARAGARQAEPRRLELGLGLLGLTVAFAVNALTNFPWRVLATQQLGWLALALLSMELAALAPPEARADGPRPSGGQDGSGMLGPWGRWVWAGLAACCFAGALFGARWFFASLLFKQGNLRKDDPHPAIQVQGIPYYEAAVRAGLSPTMQVELYLYLGSLYNLANRPDLAELWFRRGIERYPDFLEAWYNLGYTYQRRFDAGHDTKDQQAAADCYRHVLDLDPRAANAGNNLGNILYQQGDFLGAGQLYRTLLRYDPDSPEARYNLAAVSVRLKDRATAVAQLDLLLATRPDFAPAMTLRKQLGR